MTFWTFKIINLEMIFFLFMLDKMKTTEIIFSHQLSVKEKLD